MTVEQKLDFLIEFQARHPLSHVGGSIGLLLHGVDLQRDLRKSDLDIVMPDREAFAEAERIVESSGANDFDGSYRYWIDDGRYVKIELRITPEPSFEIVNYEGRAFNVSKKRDIIFWKTKYAAKGIEKHSSDLAVMNGAIRQPPIEIIETDDLPF